MRIFLSFNARDQNIAEVVRAGLKKLEPEADIFFSPVSLGSGFWLPKLAEGIAVADAFLLVIGPRGVGTWQEVEYHAALDRHVSGATAGRPFPLVPLLMGAPEAPGLPFLRQLNWVMTAAVPEERALHRALAALKGETIAHSTPLWRITNPYRGLMAMTGLDADYFIGREKETAATRKLENPASPFAIVMNAPR